jgi:hypothetical protein
MELSNEIQRILAKPWSQITVEDRKILCVPDLGGAFGVGFPIIKSPETKQNIPLIPEQNVEITKTWVIPPQGCPIEDHKFLDGQMVLADEDFKIPEGEFANCRAPAPLLFGLPELDDDCTCFMVAGVFEKGTTLVRAQNRDNTILHNVASGYDNTFNSSLDDLRSADEILEVKTIPELNLAQECDPYDKTFTENFGLKKSWTKAQKIRRDAALEKAMINFDRLCEWVPKYIAATGSAGFHQRERIISVLKRETNFVLSQFNNLGRFNYYELSIVKTLQLLLKYYEDSLYGDNTHHSKDVRRIIGSTKRKI